VSFIWIRDDAAPTEIGLSQANTKLFHTLVPKASEHTTAMKKQCSGFLVFVPRGKYRTLGDERGLSLISPCEHCNETSSCIRGEEFLVSLRERILASQRLFHALRNNHGERVLRTGYERKLLEKGKRK
jgi:hypothetical protein